MELIETTCEVCDTAVVLMDPRRIYRYRQTGRAYCSLVCSREYVCRRSSETMAETNRKYASERMKKRNPMQDPAVRKKVSRTHKKNRHRPPVQGGNGRPMPKPQVDMLAALGEGWVPEFVVLTHTNRVKGGPPTHYKIDVAHPRLKVAVEIDGSSHTSRKVQRSDARKGAFLASNGWEVVRVTNADVSDRLSDCLRQIRSVCSTSRSKGRTPTS